jgi:hypothetical protein
MSLLTANYKEKCISINDIPYNFYKEQYKDNITCRCCGSQLQAVLQTGEKIKYFRHASTDDCIKSSNDDNLLLWHILWQTTVKVENREVVKKNNKKTHRADIYIPENNYVIEIQHSHIEPDKIKEREIFYEKMIWIIDGTSDININRLCDECTTISDLCKKCTTSIKSKENSKIVFEGKDFYIISFSKKFFMNMRETVFIHCDGFICKYIAKLKGFNILCEKISFEELLKTYFVINEYSKIIENFNKLYNKTLIKYKEDNTVNYIIQNKDLIINSNKLNDFSDYGFEFINNNWLFTYKKEEDNNFHLKERKCYQCNAKNEVCNQMIDLNTKLCFDCNKNIFLQMNNCETCKKIIYEKEIKDIDTLIVQVKKNKIQKNLCDNCHIKSTTCTYCKKQKNNGICEYCNSFVMRWYLPFRKNNIVSKGKNSINYGEIIIKDDSKIYDINFNKIIINYNKDSKYECNTTNLNIYYVNSDLIEIMKIDNQNIFRTKLKFLKNSIIDTQDKNLFFIDYEEQDYTNLKLIKKDDFLKKIGLICKQKIEIKNIIEIEYALFDFDMEYGNFNDNIKTLFRQLHSINPEDLDFYDTAERFGKIAKKNKKVLEKLINWYDENRDPSNDHIKILSGNNKGKKISELNLKEIKIYLQTNVVNNKKTLLEQNRFEFIRRFHGED